MRFKLSSPGARFRAVAVALGRAALESRLLAVLWLTNLGIALVAASPLLGPVLRTFGHSLSGRERPFPSPEVLIDFSKALARTGGAPAGSLLLGLGLSLLAQALLAGGVAWRLWATEPFSWPELARQSVRLWGRNLRLFGWAALALVPVVGVALGAAVLLARAEEPTLFNIKSDHWFIDPPLGGWSAAYLALVLALLVLWRASFDLARVRLFAGDERRTRVALWRAVRRMVVSPGALLGYAAVAGLGLAALLIAARLHAALEVTTPVRAWLALLLAQPVIAVRLWASLATTAFAVQVHRASGASE